MQDRKASMPSIIGNIELRQRLCRDVLSNSLCHAYIIEGPDGSGRKTLAMMTAAATACNNKTKNNISLPCLECENCKKIIESNSLDVITLGSNGKATVGIDTARFLKEDVYIRPNDIDHKFYIIEDADKMTVQAQNAILLTLEEPPSFVHFFLICNNAASLLETIRSRAPVLRTEPISDKDIDAYICEKSGKARQMKLSSKDEYDELLKISQGSIGKALELLEDKNWSSVMEQRLLIKRFIEVATNRSGAKEVLPILSVLSPKRDILNEQLTLLSTAVRDLILLKKSDTPPLCFYSNINEAIELCDRVSMSFLFELQEAIFEALEELQRNANVRLTLIKMATSAKLM